VLRASRKEDKEMALDFTVVITVRQRFGDSDEDDVGQETIAPFVGAEKSYDFRCPNVDSRQQAILLFQCMGANIQNNLEINGQQIFGGIPSSVEGITIPDPAVLLFRAQWNGNIMLIHEGVLRENNVLRIQAAELDDGLDNFIIDNLVVVFKTRPAVVGGIPSGDITAG
jgi:hypothetical protein